MPVLQKRSLDSLCFVAAPALWVRSFFVLLTLLVLLLQSGCASRVSTADIRRQLNENNLENLEKDLSSAWKSADDMVTALNLARMYQLLGQWHESIEMYDAGLKILEDYEERAIVNVRGMLGSAGAATVSRGSAGYHGYGYERSLLHTFNGINYIMLGDYSGAAVEMRRMERRQELWLEESEEKLKSHAENMREMHNEYGMDNFDPLSGAPDGTNLSALLNDPHVRSLANSYQDAFSYSLSAAVNRIAGNADYASVSMRRASKLNGDAERMFKDGWGGRVPALTLGKKQEVLCIVLSGLAPALQMQQTRFPAPYIGYVMIDYPTFYPPWYTTETTPTLQSKKGGIPLYPLLRADFMAYRSLKDDLPYEIGTSVSRAISRSAIAIGVQAAARSHEKTADYAELVGALASFVMDITASLTSVNVRNWEMLPAIGFMGMGYVDKGSDLYFRMGQKEATVTMPDDAKGIIMVVSDFSNSNLRVDYVPY